MDGTTAFVALVALCGANVALIWQVSTLADRVDDLDDDMRATAKWFAHMETTRFWTSGRQKEQKGGGGDGAED